MVKLSNSDVKQKLIAGITLLQKIDSIFLEPNFNINERSVTHRLALHLTPLFSNYDVDCEYNRQYNIDTDEYIVKNVELEDIENKMTTKDLVAKTVYPDIIVHKRNENINLLALEVKMSWKNSHGNFDIIKAKAYKERLN